MRICGRAQCSQCQAQPACSVFVGVYAGWCGDCVRAPNKPMSIDEMERLYKHMDDLTVENGWKRPTVSPRLRAIRFHFESSVREEYIEDNEY